MREVILIAGLPGSGKSVLGKELSAQKGYVFLDDASRTVGQGLEKYIEQQAQQALGLVIADPVLCSEGVLSLARALLSQLLPGVPIRVIAFENDPKQCLENVRLRNDGRVVRDLIRYLSKTWNPADIKDCEIRSVYSNSCKA